MNKLLLTLSFLILSHAKGNAQQVHWKGSMGALNNDRATDITTTLGSDLIVIGYYSQTVDFDILDGYNNKTSVGDKDMFIQRLDRFGYLQWVMSIGGNGEINPTSVTTDALGSIVLCGSFSGTIDFDPGAGLTVLNSYGETDAFVLKLSTQGNLIWCRQFGGPNADEALDASTDDSGRVGLVGYFENSASINPDGGSFQLSSNVGTRNGFFMRLTSAGFCDAGQKFTGDPAMTTSIATFSNNQWLVGHTFSGTGTYDIFGNPDNFLEAAGSDIAISRLESNGAEIWTKSFGGSGNDQVTDLAVDPNDEFVFGGSFSDTANFSSASAPMELISQGGLDAVIARYTSDGLLLWTRTCAGIGNSSFTDLSISADASVQALGNYTQSCDLDPSANLMNINAQGGTDIFRLRVSQEGDFQEAWSYGSFANDFEGGVTCDENDNAYVAGAFTESMDADAGTGSGMVYAEGAVDAYVVKYGSCAKPNVVNPTDVFTTVGSPAIFSYGSPDAAFEWQWQVLNGNTYVNLQEDDIHSGVNSSELIISNAPLLLDMSRYRCIVSLNGCEFASSSAQLHLSCNFSIIGQSSDVTINVGENANFGVFNDVAGASLQWQILQGGSFVNLQESEHYTGVNSDLLTINGVSISENNTVYRCKLEYLGCTYFSDTRELNVLIPSGIFHHENSRLVLYPNPVEHGELNIQHAPLGETYFIVNSTGSITMQGKVYSTRETLDVSTLASGLYVLRVGEKTATFLVK
jgi:hypothetical protein